METESANVRLFDQDINKYQKLPKQGPTFSGQIKRTGYYELIEGENFGDLLMYSGGFTAEAYVESNIKYKTHR